MRSDDHPLDLPDEEYRAYWLAFREHIDWTKHEDVTAVPVTSEGPGALYRRNKGSFMEGLRPEIHCRPYAGHARRARRTGAWVPEEKVFDAALAPTLDRTELCRSVNLVMRVRTYLGRYVAGRYVAASHAATAASSRLASMP